MTEIEIEITDLQLQYSKLNFRGFFKLMEKYEISIALIEDSNKKWTASSGALGYDFTSNGEWVQGDTPYLAVRSCLNAINETLKMKCPSCKTNNTLNQGYIFCPKCGHRL